MSIDINLQYYNNDTAKVLKEKLASRTQMEVPEITAKVLEIISELRLNGDLALRDYSLKFDKVSLAENFELVESDYSQAVNSLGENLKLAMKKAADNIFDFHKKQLQLEKDLWLEEEGKLVGLTRRPLERVGIYVPGGTAPLPSSVLMNAIPAKVAGVEEIIMCTPPRKDGSVDPSIIYAAKLAGVDRVYTVGGAQAVAAMAYGTASIPKVDKIVGPGNIYVSTAKRLVYGQVDIDMFAGPSEILIIADEGIEASSLAYDLMSQAEHDVLASAILLTDSEQLALAVKEKVAELWKYASRKSILSQSLNHQALIVICNDLEAAVELSNYIAPEHLELAMSEDKSKAYLPKIKNAGAVFVGYYSPEPLGDYWAGANHVLPTSGTARFFSPLNTGDFIKKISVINYSEDALRAVADDIIILAEAEGLDCHANSVAVRFGKNKVYSGSKISE